MMRFFEPTQAFLGWLAAYARDRLVFDVGCGAGHITLALRDRGVRVLGIDPRFAYVERVPLGLHNCILPVEARDCRLLREAQDSLVLFCRPCHSGFVADTIDVLPRTAEVLYISKPCNVAYDLPDFKVRVVRAPECPEERVYQVLRTQPAGGSYPAKGRRRRA